MISTHTLTWSVTFLWNKIWSFAKFQLTRSRGAWPIFIIIRFVMQKFQLTRSRGAWLDFLIQKMQESIFQLTRSRGAWHRATWNYLHMVNFNSHAHVERDDFKIRIISATVAISTHTLTWSVTFPSSSMPLSQNDFNSHAHVERDLSGVINDIHRYQFQLTRSRGAWRVCKASADLSRIISTHTLTWSVTYALIDSVPIVEISTHTLTWSVTMQL